MKKEIMPAGNITEKSVFGAYSKKENRVTAALLHLIDEGKEPLLREIFDDLPDSDILVSTQVSTEDNNARNSIYDGIVSCGFCFKYIIESKVSKNAVNKEQLIKYKAQAQNEKATLIYITPDDRKPDLLKDVTWYSWEYIAMRLKAFEDKNELLQYLIDQFILLLANLGLYEDWKERVLIVGGSIGEPIASQYHFYNCQNNRHFKRCEYLAFAYRNKISTLFKIKGLPQDNIDLRNVPEIANSDYFSKVDTNYSGQPQKLFLLEKDNILEKTIINDKTSLTGKKVSFVQRQTYTTLEKIKAANYTSEL